MHIASKVMVRVTKSTSECASGYLRPCFPSHTRIYDDHVQASISTARHKVCHRPTSISPHLSPDYLRRRALSSFGLNFCGYRGKGGNYYCRVYAPNLTVSRVDLSISSCAKLLGVFDYVLAFTAPVRKGSKRVITCEVTGDAYHPSPLWPA